MIGHDFYAAVGGAVVGGVIAALVQIYSSHRQEAAQRRAHAVEVAERAALRREAEAGTAFSLIQKVNRALTTIRSIHETLSKGQETAVRTGNLPSNVTLPSASDDVVIEFNDVEMGLLQRACRAGLLSRALDLPYVQRTYVEFMRRYREMRGRLPELMSHNELHEDGFSTSTFEGVNAHKAEILQSEMNSDLKTLSAWSTFDYAHTNNILFDMYHLFLERFGEEGLHIRMNVRRMDEPADPRPPREPAS